MAVTMGHSLFQHPSTWVMKSFIVTCCNKLIVVWEPGLEHLSNAVTTPQIWPDY